MKLGTIQISLGVVGGALTWIFGGWDLLLQYLILFMVLDYVTGLIKAGFNKEISYKVGFVGLAKKVGILAIVAVAHGLDQLFASETSNIFGLEFPVIRTIVIWGYLINESISILENIKLLGVPLPPVLQKILSIIKEDVNSKSNSIKE